MPESPNASDSSRGRYHAYRERVRGRAARETEASANGARHGAAAAGHDHAGGDKSIKRSRSFFGLLKAFFGLLRGHRPTLAAALITLAVSTILGLVPLYCPKLIVDNVLDTKPLPQELSWLKLPTDPRRLLAYA